MKFILLTVFLLFNAHGEDLKEEEVSLDNLLLFLLERNPELRAAEREWLSALYMIKPAGALPDPEISLSLKNESFSNLSIKGEMMSSFGLGFKQEIPFPLKLSLSRKIQKEMADFLYQKYRALKLKLVRELKENYIDYWFAFEEERFLKKMREELLKVKESTLALYSAGRVIQENVFKVDVEISRIDEKLIMNEVRKEEIKENILKLIGLPYDYQLTSPSRPEMDFEDMELNRFIFLAENFNPEIKAEEKATSFTLKEFKLSKYNYLPDFTVSGGWFLRRGFPDMWEGMIEVKLPLYFWTKQVYEVKSARENYNSQKNKQDAIKNRVITRLKFYIKAYERKRHLLHIYENFIIPSAENAFRSASYAYSTGTVDFLTLLEDLIVYYQYRIEYSKTFAEAFKYLAGIQELAGIED